MDSNSRDMGKRTTYQRMPGLPVLFQIAFDHMEILKETKPFFSELRWNPLQDLGGPLTVPSLCLYFVYNLAGKYSPAPLRLITYNII